MASCVDGICWPFCSVSAKSGAEAKGGRKKKVIAAMQAQLRVRVRAFNVANKLHDRSETWPCHVSTSDFSAAFDSPSSRKSGTRASLRMTVCCRRNRLLISATFAPPVTPLYPQPDRQQPFQHNGPRQTNKRFPCSLSRQRPPCPRLCRPQCCLCGPATAKHKQH